MELKGSAPEVFCTEKGTAYLKSPGVSLVGSPQSHLQEALASYLPGFDKSLQFEDYMNDEPLESPGEAIAKFAGQVCYQSLGPQRTHNKYVGKYFDHIKESKHGSVTEHINFTFLFWGISRSVSHEIVRHRTASYSQVSQRYVGEKTLRFVERPEFQSDFTLHRFFEARIDRASLEYETLSEMLLEKLEHSLAGMSKTEARKAVRQTARSILPNETETAMVMTANVRSWRHFLEMRCSRYAETEIRRLAMLVYGVLKEETPHLFNDYTPVSLPDGTFELETAYRKI